MSNVLRLAIVDPDDTQREALKSMLLGMDMIWLEAECSRYEFFSDVVAQTDPDIGLVAIDADVDPDELRATHFAYDLTDARQDINVVFPIDALRTLVADGLVGELAPQLFTCMGGIYSQRRVRDDLAPALVQRCQDDEIDVVLLVPV